MRLMRGLSPNTVSGPGTVVTIGNFDGCHRGHQAVFARALAAAHERALATALITFEPLPLEFFAPERAPLRLQRLRDRVDAARDAGFDLFWAMRFASALASLEAEDFVQQCLHKVLRARHILVGDDFRFGKNRMGDFSLLERMGRELGFSVEATPTVADAGGRISSTRLRSILQGGSFSEAAELLGREYRITGRVAHGDKRGRQLGFPTANLRLGPRPMVLRGVYAGWLHDLNTPEPCRWAAVANIGWRPTVGGSEQRLEAHVLDQTLDLYGRIVSFEPLQALRGEQRFANLDALRAQIGLDLVQARAIFHSLAGTGTTG